MMCAVTEPTTDGDALSPFQSDLVWRQIFVFTLVVLVPFPSSLIQLTDRYVYASRSLVYPLTHNPITFDVSAGGVGK